MARLLLAADGHYFRDSSGDVYVDSVFGYSFYQRYLEVFEDLIAFGRVTNVDKVAEGKKRADGEGVSFLDLKPGAGMQGLLKTGVVNRRIIREAVKEADYIIARVPGMVGNMVALECRRQKKPFAIEVVVDPWEYFAPNANGGKFAPVVRRLWTSQLRKDCMSAICVSYVTEKYLQARYPCGGSLGKKGYYATYYSSVDLPDNSFGSAKVWPNLVEQLKIVHVANNFAGDGKGHKTLFRACRILKNQGIDFKLTCIGDGPSMQEFKNVVKELDISEDVVFAGRLSDGGAVRKIVQLADVFVFPTRAEGLPRVLLEAMSEGIPCLSTPVCGIPEILPPECLFAPDDAEGFANKLSSLSRSSSDLRRLSEEGLEVARRYANSKLQSKRNEFYRQTIIKTKEA